MTSTSSSDHEPPDDANSGLVEGEEEEEEPKLKYHRITEALRDVYRNGEAVSSFTVAGDKMVLGTHNGIVHVLQLPGFEQLKVYRAHSATISHISVSIPPVPNPSGLILSSRQAVDASPFQAPKDSSPARVKALTSGNKPRSSLHIGTASLDGNVCVQSLIDPKDVTVRDFARPLQALALSPSYKTDQTYLSGGRAGKLVLTQGLPFGSRSKTNLDSGVVASGSAWLGAVGLSSNTNRDTALHSGEGPIAVIKWSNSGLFVAWVNELGIKIMRSHIGIQDTEESWRRMAHVDRPKGSDWEEMSGSWKASVEWVDSRGLESSVEVVPNGMEPGHSHRDAVGQEKLIVGWGDSTWVIQVKRHGPGKTAVAKGDARVTHFLRLTDCIVAGLTAFTRDSLAILAYLKPISAEEDESSGDRRESTSGHRQRLKGNASPPELRLIDITTSNELSVDRLDLSSYQSLTSRDYHVTALPAVPEAQTKKAPAQTDEKLWLKFADPAKLLSSSASMFSSKASSDQATAMASQDSAVVSTPPPNIKRRLKPDVEAELTSGKLKIFVTSPFDCILAVKRDVQDHLNWLLQEKKYEEAWNLLQQRADGLGQEAELAPTETEQDVFVEKAHSRLPSAETDSLQASSTTSSPHSATQKEKQRIGELWIQQLIASNDWTRAGEVCEKVLTTPSRWEFWVADFRDAGKLDLIGSHVPDPEASGAPGSIVYDTLLMHYAETDRLKMQHALGLWSTQFFTPSEIISVICDVVDSEEVKEDSMEGGVKGRDWKILQASLIQLYQANGNPRLALKHAMIIKDYQKTMDLIGEYHLLDAVAHDIPGFVLLSLGTTEIDIISLETLRDNTFQVMQLLVSEAFHGTVSAGTVVSQLEDRQYHKLLYLYLEALWHGHGAGDSAVEREMSESRQVVNRYADLAVETFAEYNEPLLIEFIKTSNAYSLEKAIKICEGRRFIPELVYLLSRTGQMKRALNLIIDELDDVQRAIEFAKTQNDAELWDDFMDYSMSKPRFIKGLLREAGSGINPIRLVGQIPNGLEIEGLKGDVSFLLREFEVQASISKGVVKVMQGEVLEHMNELHQRQRRGIRFGKGPEKTVSDPTNAETPAKRQVAAVPMTCARCSEQLAGAERGVMIGFPCGHLFHVGCLLKGSLGHNERGTDEEHDADEEYAMDDVGMGVGRKVGKLMQLKGKLSSCPLEDHG